MNDVTQLPIMVYERSGRWAAALRSLPLPSTARLFEFRTLVHVDQQLSETPGAMVCLETTPANLLEVYCWLWAAGREHPHARCVVLSSLTESDESASVERDVVKDTTWVDLLREAGAVYAISSTRDVEALLPIMRRYLSNTGFVTLNSSFDGRTHSAQPNVVEQLLADLPWKL